MTIWNSITAFFSRLWNGSDDLERFPWTDEEFEARIYALIEEAERGDSRLAIRARYEGECG
jgi:hypothetical protein